MISETTSQNVILQGKWTEPLKNITISNMERGMLIKKKISLFLILSAVISMFSVPVKALNPGDAPKAVFAITEGDTVEAVYAYCNLHGLWKA